MVAQFEFLRDQLRLKILNLKRDYIVADSELIKAMEDILSDLKGYAKNEDTGFSD